MSQLSAWRTYKQKMTTLRQHMVPGTPEFKRRQWVLQMQRSAEIAGMDLKDFLRTNKIELPIGVRWKDDQR